MSLHSALRAGRAAFDGMLTDACVITKDGIGPRIFYEDTGQYVNPDRIAVYAGPCRIQVKADINSNVVEVTAGEHEWTYLTAQLQLPVEDPVGSAGSVNDVDVNHVCEITSAPYEASLVGSLFNIQGTYHKSQAVYLRFRVKEVVA